MSPVRINLYPQYDVRKIIKAFKYPTTDLVNVYAHRGHRLRLGATENSLSAVAGAALAGYEGIEIDVRLSKDGQVVILHDEGLGRISDIKRPSGQDEHNPFTGKGYSPLVKETNWFGVMEDLRIKDVNGNQTSERILLLSELLDFIRDEGINMLVQLDIKDLDALSPAYDIIAGRCNSMGVPAMHWCVWKCLAQLFPTPDQWEAQEWVQKALQSGQGMLYMPLYQGNPADTVESIKAWASKDYVLTFEIQLSSRDSPVQKLLEFAQTDPCWSKGITSWRISGDLPREYYEEDGITRWEDSSVRADILACGPKIPIQFVEGQGINAVGGVLGQPYSPQHFDGRAHLSFLLEEGFTSLVADVHDDLGEQLRKLGKRNVSRMLAKPYNGA